VTAMFIICGKYQGFIFASATAKHYYRRQAVLGGKK